MPMLDEFVGHYRLLLLTMIRSRQLAALQNELNMRFNSHFKWVVISERWSL